MRHYFLSYILYMSISYEIRTSLNLVHFKPNVKCSHYPILVRKNVRMSVRMSWRRMLVQHTVHEEIMSQYELERSECNNNLKSSPHLFTSMPLLWQADFLKGLPFTSLMELLLENIGFSVLSFSMSGSFRFRYWQGLFGVILGHLSATLSQTWPNYSHCFVFSD